MGAGRSGTSMVAGLLAKAGYFMGQDLFPGRDSNPKGFFEAPEINGINEELIQQSGTMDEALPRRWFSAYHPKGGQRWLARLTPGARIHSTPPLNHRMACLVNQAPFCFKDPRFCYTLPAWRPHLKDTVFICVFRDPVSTVNSIMKECAAMEYLHDLNMTFETALDVWKLMYQHVLATHRQSGDWLFIHYEQVISGDALDKISRLTSAHLDPEFPDSRLRRSHPDRHAGAAANRIYFELCQLAQCDPGTFHDHGPGQIE